MSNDITDISKIPGARPDMIVAIPIEEFDVAPGRGLYYVESVPDNITAGGIHKPDIASGKQPESTRWRVVEVGMPAILNDGTEIAPLYNVGDVLWLSRQAGILSFVPDTTPARAVVSESAVLAKLTRRAQ